MKGLIFFLCLCSLASAQEREGARPSRKLSVSQKVEIEALAKQLAENQISREHLTLCRLKPKSFKLRAQYVDELKDFSLKGSSEWTTFVKGLSAKDSFKNHMVVRAFTSEEEVNTKRLIRDNLGFPSIKKKGKKSLPIDWGSNQASFADPSVHFFNSNAGNGHSEPAFIEEMKALWTKDHDSVIKLFMPKDKDTSVSMTGFELHGTLDMCDTCLESLRCFRQTYQKGQQSISYAVRHELERQKVKFTGRKSDGFVLIYHAYFPYREATYYAEDEASYYDDFAYSYSFSDSRHDIFQDQAKAFNSSHVLSHLRHVEPHRDIIYGHLHYLSGMEARYNKAKRSFIFQ